MRRMAHEPGTIQLICSDLFFHHVASSVALPRTSSSVSGA
jgi:hypothetical protein